MADLSLLAIAAFWGSSYLLTKIGLRDLSEFNLVALRFIIGFVATGIMFRKNLSRINGRTVKKALILSAILFVVFATATIGVKLTSVSNAAFLSTISVVFIPFISLMLYRDRPNVQAVLGVALAAVGMGLLTLNGQLSVNLGDLLCLTCSLLYALHLVLTGKFIRDVDSVALAVLQLGFVGLFSLIFSFGFETATLPSTGVSWAIVLALALVCTGVPMVVQTVAQRYTDPTRTGLILSLEPVFAAALAFVAAGEILATRGYVGAALLLVGVLVSEWEPVETTRSFRKMSRMQ
jgi:drug/metabolite transporter (DMT)-like permease